MFVDGEAYPLYHQSLVLTSPYYLLKTNLIHRGEPYASANSATNALVPALRPESEKPWIRLTGITIEQHSPRRMNSEQTNNDLMYKNWFYIFFILAFLVIACNHNHPKEKPVIVSAPEKMDDVVSGNIKEILAFAIANNGRINDTAAMSAVNIVSAFYHSNHFKSIWSSNEVQNPLADSLTAFISQARYYGLFPSDYHGADLLKIHQLLQSDSMAMKNAMLWTQLDLLSTDAFFMLLKDLKQGRIVDDSMSILKKEHWVDSFFIHNLQEVFDSGKLTSVLDMVQPDIVQYRSLRQNLKDFVDSMDTTSYLPIVFPYTDTLEFKKSVYARMLQEGIGQQEMEYPDSIQFATALKAYQKKHSLDADGKIGPATVRSMNKTDRNKFISAAISLDRYKQMDTLPDSYVWVNIPSFKLELWDDDTISLTSKVIVGKPQTPTPELFSRINNLVIFPTWTIPTSIIKKDILPELKKDPGYLARKGYNLFTDSGTIVNPYTVNWAKYKTGIPWKVVQGSGDDNALGIFKFNFSNPFSVYLHDTNQRYLFANTNRALSHGCVRVQKWQQLADYIAIRDSILQSPGRLNYSKDSLRVWIKKEERKSIMVKNRLPLYIVYFTCAAEGNKLEFYDDIYGYEHELANKYFKGK